MSDDANAENQLRAMERAGAAARGGETILERIEKLMNGDGGLADQLNDIYNVLLNIERTQRDIAEMMARR